MRYESVYRGIDIVYRGNRRGNRRQLEYDFVVAPHAAPERIRLAFDGADTISIGDAGELVLHTAGGDLVQPRPHVYQDIDGRRVRGEGDYALLPGGGVGFRLGHYDRRETLIIDPVLVYSTFLGGASLDEGLAIAVDADGNAYLTGLVESLTFPGVGGSSLQPSFAGVADVFVTQIDPTGTQILYSTYFGGDGDDEAMGIAVDAAGAVYVTGWTGSTNFPIAGGVQPAFGGGWLDGFVLKIAQ